MEFSVLLEERRSIRAFTKNTKIQTSTKNESFVDPVNPDIVFSF